MTRQTRQSRNTEVDSRGEKRSNAALLHKSAEGQRFPLPSQTYPVTSGMGVPCAVKPFKTATRT